jgi:major membrane immunogen (membrane-anchored lipoprotein)
MNKKLLLSTASAFFSLGLLTACGAADNNNNRLNDTENVDYRPVRYDRNDNNRLDNDERRNVRDNNVAPVDDDRDNNFDFDLNDNDNNRDFLDTNNNDRYNRSLLDNDDDDNDKRNKNRGATGRNLPGMGGTTTTR